MGITTFQDGDQHRLNNLFTERYAALGQRYDGSSFPLHIRLSEMQLGSQRFLTGILSDATEHHCVPQMQLGE